MKQGDIIQITAPDVPLPFFQAAVVEVNGDDLEVLSTYLVPFQHPGTFKLSQIKVEVVTPAEEAVERITGFAPGTRLTTVTRKGVRVEGALALGFGPYLTIRLDDGQLCTGSKTYFTAV